MKPRPVSEVIDQDRRQLLSTAAMGIAAIAVAGTLLATSAFAQSAREIRGASPFDTIQNEPAPKLMWIHRFPVRWPGPIPGPVSDGKRAHLTGVRPGCPQRISTSRASPHNRQRLALVVGGCE